MKIIVDVERGEKIQQLTANLGQMAEQVIKTNTAMKAQGATTAQVVASLAPLNSKISATAMELKSLEAVSHGMGRGLGQLSYAIDDIQYGFNAIVNNIPQIVMGLGGSMGLAGAIGIAAVAVNQLIKHWSELTASLEQAWTGGSWDQILQLKKRLEDAAEGYEKLTKAKTKWEEEGGKAGAQTIANFGVGKLTGNLAATMTAAGTGAQMTEDERRAAESVKNANPGVKKGVMDRIQKRLLEENTKEAERLLGSIGIGGEVEAHARARIKELIAKNPAAFKDFEEEFHKSDPAELKLQEEAKKKGDAQRKVDLAAADVKKHDEADARKDAKEAVEFRKKKRIEDMQDGLKSLEEERDRIKKEMHKPHQQQAEFQSYQGYLSSLAQQEINKIPADQLKKLEDIENVMKEVEKAIRETRREKAVFN